MKGFRVQALGHPDEAAAGVFPTLPELGASFGGQFEERTEIDETSGAECVNSENGIGDLVIAAKWQFLKESGVVAPGNRAVHKIPHFRQGQGTWQRQDGL